MNKIILHNINNFKKIYKFYKKNYNYFFKIVKFINNKKIFLNILFNLDFFACIIYYLT